MLKVYSSNITYRVGHGGGPPLSGPESSDDIANVVERKGGDGVAPAVHAEGGAPRHLEVELDVGGLLLLELEVPVAVGRDPVLLALPEGQVGEGGAVWRQGSAVAAQGCGRERKRKRK